LPKKINIIEILNEHGGSMTRDQLIAYVRRFGVNYSSLKSVLGNLTNEGSIKTSGETIVAINTCRADQIFKPGVVNEDGSLRRTGHRQVSIRYDQTLFRFVGRSGKLLRRVVVDEGMVDLLEAIWKHGIPTIKSCQGGNGETVWIRFMSLKDADRFRKLVSHLPQDGWILNKQFELSFPPEDITKIVEELNKT
jgi:hypothetical protein